MDQGRNRKCLQGRELIEQWVTLGNGKRCKADRVSETRSVAFQNRKVLSEDCLLGQGVLDSVFLLMKEHLNVLGIF